MLGRFLPAGLAVVLAVTALSGCGGGGDGGQGGTASPSPATTRTQAPLDRAKDALLTAQEIPVPPPSDTVELPSSYSAQGDQVSAPWPQFMICSSVGKADEGPPTVVEPGAAAGAWAFGVATTEGGRQGYSQVDQYAIVYTDEAAAQAAVQRAKELDCDEAIKAWGYPELEWTVATGPVPASVSGFRTTGTFTIPSEDSTQDSVSTVMRAGNTVHYMRMSESSGGGRDGILDQEYVERLITAAADNLAS